MELFVVRHGKAEDFGPNGSDRGRRLTEKGWRQAQAVGHLLQVLDLVPDLVLTSPLTRARETASGLMKAAGMEENPVVQEWLGFSMHGEVALRELAALEGAVERVVIVGHEPSFSEFLEWLLGVRGAMIEVKKASVAWISLVPRQRRSAVLKMLVPPKVLLADYAEGL